MIEEKNENIFWFYISNHTGKCPGIQKNLIFGHKPCFSPPSYYRCRSSIVDSLVTRRWISRVANVSRKENISLRPKGQRGSVRWSRIRGGRPQSRWEHVLGAIKHIIHIEPMKMIKIINKKNLPPKASDTKLSDPSPHLPSKASLLFGETGNLCWDQTHNEQFQKKTSQ